MTTNTYEAIYENGVFRPLAGTPDIPEGQRVRLTIEPRTPEDILALARKVYEGLSEDEINEIERIATARGNFFSGRTPDDV